MFNGTVHANLRCGNINEDIYLQGIYLLYMKKQTLILIGFILLKFVLSYTLINPVYDLQRDEYLHLDQANHLSWGYISVPPMSSWIAWLIKILGNGVFWVKFFPALFGAGTLYFTWKMMEALNADLPALILGATAILVSAILRVNILFQPNSLDIFWWTFLYYCVSRFIQTSYPRWIYAAAIACALGFLSKYNIAFAIIGLAPAFLLTSHRKIFLNKHLYIAAGLALLIISPNLLWQYQHDFPTYYQLKELNSTQLVHVERSGFLKEQLLFFISSLFVIVAGLVSFFTYRQHKPFRLFFWSFFISLFTFMYFKAKGYYAIGLYPVIIAFGAVYLAALCKKFQKNYIMPVLVAIVVIISIPLFMIGFPTKPPAETKRYLAKYKDIGILRWEDGKNHDLPQDFADMLGWSELAAKVDSAYSTLSDKEHTLVYCDNYGQAGAINYYSSFKNIGAVSLNADYIYWIPLHKPIKNVIRVKDIYDRETDRSDEKKMFEKVYLFGRIENEFAREKGTSIYVFENARINVNAIIQKDIDEYNQVHFK